MSSADSTVIRPRWEWRTFGTHFGVAEDAFAALTPTDVAESDELYLLAAGGDTVKIRADLLDIKVLREVDAAGLERWEPILKVPFPLSRAHVGQVGASLKLVLPAPSRDEYTLEQLVGELLEPTGAVRAVPVHKRRVRYTVGGCSAELSDVVADGRTTRTIAIESEDAAAVVKAVASVGLDGFVNTSYPRGLAALLDGLAARFAIIDVGTNSVKFHLGERSTEGTWQTVMDRAEVTRLGEGVGEHGEIAPDALDRTATAISGMADEARVNGAIVVLAVGTAGLRAARNQETVLTELQARTGITVRVISGEDEGRLAHLAAVEWLDRPPGSVVVFDTGGGSTQFSFGHGTHVEERFSVPVGAVRYTERFDLGGEVARRPSSMKPGRPSVSTWPRSTAARRPTPSWRWAEPSRTSRP